MQLVFFAYITMKKLFLFLFLAFTSITFAQQTYKLYVEGEKQWAYRENALTDFVYAFCTKDFEAIAKNPVVRDSLKVALLESIYNKMLQSIPMKDKNTEISLFFGERKKGKGRIFFMTFFEGKRRFTYQEPSVKLKTRYQKEVMQEYEAHALEKNAKKELENYINTRKRWRKMIIVN